VLTVGEIEVRPVIDGMIVSQLPASKPLPDPDTDAWRDQHMFRPDGMIESTVGGFLVRTGDRLVLVDAGAGQAIPGGYSPPVVDLDDDEDPFVATFLERGAPREMIGAIADHFSHTQMERGRLPASLAALGVDPAEVTDLVFTHLHFDHIGWASEDGTAFFPNATIHCAAPDLDHFLADPADERTVALVFDTPLAPERLAPVLDRIETWEGDGTLFPGVDVRLTPGHTPGSSVVVLADGDQRAMLLGDMIHCPLELMDDEFDLLVDVDQEAAIRVREAYARELEGSDISVSAAHFPGLQFGRLLPGEGIRRWSFDA
jgi:glyoxylase-like metal-dependent hydrolase (beta-lactamase superfamily II)